LLLVEWIPTTENDSDMFTKNLQGPLFAKHASVYVSDVLSMDSQREGVTGRVLSHGGLVIESHQDHGSGPVLGAGLGGKPMDQRESSKNKDDGQDLDWKSKEGHEQDKMPKEGYG
jgi:hypothetical protein